MSSRVQLADVVTTSIDGYTGRLDVIVIAKGDVLLAIDLRKAKLETVNHEYRTAVLALPRPRITSPRLDHERTIVFAIQTSGMWRMLPTDARRAELVSRAMEVAQQAMASAADSNELIERARSSAERLLKGYVDETLHWDLSIRWLDQTSRSADP